MHLSSLLSLLLPFFSLILLNKQLVSALTLPSDTNQLEDDSEHAQHWVENSVLDYGHWQIPKTYYGHKVLRVYPRNERQRRFLYFIRTEGSWELDFWSEIGPVNASVDFRVPPYWLEFVEKMLEEERFQPVVIVEDVQKLIDKERRENRIESRWRRSLETNRDFRLNKYHPLDEIIDFESFIASKYPDLVHIDVIGNSSEGRELRVIRVGRNRYASEGDGDVGGRAYSKPGIWIDGGAHAREWISPATVLYMLSQLLVYSETDHDVRYLVNNIDWYFLTVVNPDGYHYSWITDRMWRKTRSRHVMKRDCYGVDPNRNFDYHWGETGTSSNPCSQLYRGPHANSEPEIAAISSYLLERRESIKCFMSFHANGQLWMLPWAYTKDLPPTYSSMLTLATKALRALTSKHGTMFLTGSVANMIYEASGSSADWAHGVAGIPYTYGIELRDFGYYNFMLPASQILPSGEEVWAAVRVIADEIIEKSLEEERRRVREGEEEREREDELEELAADGNNQASIDGLLLMSDGEPGDGADDDGTIFVVGPEAKDVQRGLQEDVDDNNISNNTDDNATGSTSSYATSSSTSVNYTETSVLTT